MATSLAVHSHGRAPRADLVNFRFSTDLVGRYLCNTLEETAAPFDVVILGAGMVGIALAYDLYRFLEERGKARRILLLDAGGVVLTSHCQDLPFHPHDQPLFGVRDWPWSTTEHGYQSEASGLLLAIGGRSLAWSGWADRLDEADFARPGQEWPCSPEELGPHYEVWEQRMGVTEPTPMTSGGLQAVLHERLESSDDPVLRRARPAPLAIAAGAATGQRRFCGVPLLLETVRRDVHLYRRSGGDAAARLMVVPFWRATRLEVEPDGGEIRVRRVRLARRRGDGTLEEASLSLPPGAIVVLACGTIETTRLCLASPGLPNPDGQIGRNLILHLRADLACTWAERAAFPSDGAGEIGIATLVARGETAGSQRPLALQIQIQAADLQPGSWVAQRLPLLMPDLDAVQLLLDTHRGMPVAAIVRGLAELPADAANRIDLDPVATDAFGVPLARIHLHLGEEAVALRAAMAAAMERAAAALRPTQMGGVFHCPAGTSHHEAGTLAMGRVTDSWGRIRGTSNAYVAGPALFPSVGGAPPALTALALARRTAAHLAETL